MNLLAVTSETWITVGIVAGIFAGSALLIGILILVVGKVFKVNVDEKITRILDNLAGANCGGCGCSGCSGFAQKLAEGGAVLSDCHVTSPEKKAEIAKLLGIELKDEEPTVAIVHCNGGTEHCADKFEYVGNPTCAACNALLNGNKACSYACLGCGDCKAVCPENAISVEGRLAKIDPDRCVHNCLPQRHYRQDPRIRSRIYRLLVAVQGQRSYERLLRRLYRLRYLR